MAAMKIARAARRLWAAPLTLCGLTFALPLLAAGAAVKRTGPDDVPVFAFEDGLFRGLLLPYRWILRPDVSGLCIGRTIFVAHDVTDPAVLRHEMIHVRQAERNGLFQPLLYLLSSLCAWRAGLDPYRDNHFEQAAYGDAERR